MLKRGRIKQEIKLVTYNCVSLDYVLDINIDYNNCAMYRDGRKL